MLGAIARRFFGSANDRFLKGLHDQVEQINRLEPELELLDDAALADRTRVFKERLAAGETLDDLLPDAFATVRRRQSVPSASAITTSSSWAAWCCTRA